MNKKQRDLELQAFWEKIKAVNAKPLERGAKAKATVTAGKSKPKLPKLTIPPERSSRAVSSFDSGKGSTALSPTTKYTGHNVLGVVVMHKSCLQPVFSQEAVHDAATMRR